MLSASRFNVLFAGLTSAAQKVYEVVPMAESWTHSQIYAELVRNKISINHNIMCGCVNSLIAQGLVVEPSRGQFRRVAIRPAAVKRAPAPETPVPAPTPAQEEEPMKPAPAPVVAAAPANPIDKLGLLAARVAKIAAELVEVSAAINDAAVEAQGELEASAADSAKLRQLQSILKSVA